ncbi:hypothetical protein [Jeotgalibacillus proteolyticus]|uniref:Uncharacterized protein n=1 Tax=Jeotgalibacillus proteolyticus TaxID=2082395 RepID=A0A2S5G815_9BACL|nr:hypothetical protein [Jeotgalibacillus proteolyticus]PPA69061.1 hypothetical protein C4B60_17250 [Jeotgalibacillus proteolyticus]
MTDVDGREKKQTEQSRENKSSFDLLKEKHEKEMNELYVRLQELLDEFKMCHYFKNNRHVR